MSYDALKSADVSAFLAVVNQGADWNDAYHYATHDVSQARQRAMWDYVAVTHGVHCR